jgi:hypothetical protein
MMDSKIIDLRPYGIAREIDARIIHPLGIVTINANSGISNQSVLVVGLKTGEQLKGPVISESEAVRQREDLFAKYQKIIQR